MGAADPGAAGPQGRRLTATGAPAITLKGRLRGLQSGTSAVAVAVVDSAERAGEWAVKPHGRRFAALAYPVLVDLANERVVRPERMLIGAVYAPYLRQLVKEHVEPSLRLV